MDYLAHLKKDRTFSTLLDKHEPFQLARREDLCLYLCASIMSQQLSSKVATTIHRRFLDLYGSRAPTPEEILSTPAPTLRAIGLSNAKVSYVHNVARFFIEEGMDHQKLHAMTNEEVISYLTRIKGVGRWTAEMLLMFGLGREDIFALDDMGIQNAMIHLYKLDNTDKKSFRSEMVRISERWSPYRTFACLHLWQWKDNSPASPKKAKAAPAKKAKGFVKKTKGAVAKKAGKKKAARKKAARKKASSAKITRKKATPAKVSRQKPTRKKATAKAAAKVRKPAPKKKAVRIKKRPEKAKK